MRNEETISLERVLISDALDYLKERTGYDFNRRQFTRWVESGQLHIDGSFHKIESSIVGGRWYITRQSLDNLVSVLTVATDRSQ